MLTVNKLSVVVVFFGLLLAVTETKAIDLALDIDFADYNDGVFIGESTVVTVTVSHLGPEAVDLSLVRFLGKYNYLTSEVNPFQYFVFASEDQNCSLDQPMFDPRPPVNNYTDIYIGRIKKTLQPFSSVSCEFIFTTVEQGIYDTLWELSLVSADPDPDLTNNSVQFTFGPQPRPVPLNLWAAVLFILVILASFRINKIE